MVKQDLQAIRRAEHERDPNYKPRLKARIAKSFVEDALMPATRGDLAVRAPRARLPHDRRSRRVAEAPGHLARILRIWAMSEKRKRARGFYPPSSGPERAEMLARLGLAA
jgi:hypothetical protein